MERNIKKINFMLMLLPFVLVMISCEKNDEEADECEKTKWNEAIHYNVMPKIRVLGDNIPGYDLKEAKLITYTGSIKKYYCKDNGSTSFVYSPGEFYPEFIEEEYWKGGFFIAESYGFFFNNDEDYLKVNLELEAIFDNFTSYKTRISLKVKPSEIFIDIDNIKEYFYIDLTSETDW